MEVDLKRLINIARNCFERNLFADGMESILQILNIDKNSFDGLDMACTGFYHFQDFENLYRYASAGAGLYPDRLEFYHHLYNLFLYFGKDDYINARDVMRKAIECNPTDSQSYYNLGEVYLINWEYQKAKHYFELAVRYNPRDSVYLSRLGIAVLRSGDVKGAFAIAEQALIMDLKNVWTYNNCGQIYLFAGELDRAEFLLRHATSIPSRNPYFGKQLENCLREKADRDNRVKSRRRYLPLYKRQKGEKRFFDEDLNP
jgi:tetratricopeptide (TPR) repeat protein